MINMPVLHQIPHIYTHVCMLINKKRILFILLMLTLTYYVYSMYFLCYSIMLINLNYLYRITLYMQFFRLCFSLFFILFHIYDFSSSDIIVIDSFHFCIFKKRFIRKILNITFLNYLFNIV